jgi:hypothetical protein
MELYGIGCKRGAKEMKQIVMAIILFAGFCCAQQSGGFQPSATNVWGSEYPRVDNTGRVQIRVKAPEATKVKVNFWSGPKVDMVKQPDGFWIITTTPLALARRWNCRTGEHARWNSTTS